MTQRIDEMLDELEAQFRALPHAPQDNFRIQIDRQRIYRKGEREWRWLFYMTNELGGTTPTELASNTDLEIAFEEMKEAIAKMTFDTPLDFVLNRTGFSVEQLKELVQ